MLHLLLGSFDVACRNQLVENKVCLVFNGLSNPLSLLYKRFSVMVAHLLLSYESCQYLILKLPVMTLVIKFSDVLSRKRTDWKTVGHC